MGNMPTLFGISLQLAPFIGMAGQYTELQFFWLMHFLCRDEQLFEVMPSYQSQDRQRLTADPEWGHVNLDSTGNPSDATPRNKASVGMGPNSARTSFKEWQSRYSVETLTR